MGVIVMYVMQTVNHGLGDYLSTLKNKHARSIANLNKTNIILEYVYYKFETIHETQTLKKNKWIFGYFKYLFHTKTNIKWNEIFELYVYIWFGYLHDLYIYLVQ